MKKLINKFRSSILCTALCSISFFAQAQPANPGNQRAANITQTSFTFLWDASSGATEYLVYKDGGYIGSTTTALSYNITGLTAGTTYGMLVKAKNSANQYSWAPNTNITTAAAGGVSSGGKYEAESAQLTGLNTATNATGYSGTGFVTGFDNTTDKIIFTVNVSAAGNYPLTIRYQAGSEKYQDVKVSGGGYVYTQFPAAASFTDKNFGSIALNAGNNTIEIKSNWGWFDLDYIQLGTGTPAGGGGGGNTGTYNRVRKFGTNVNVMYSDEGCQAVWDKGHYLRAQNINFATETNPWNTTFINEAKMYQVHRFMNWTGGNGDATKNWTDRTYKTDLYQFGGYMANNGEIPTKPQANGRNTRGVAYEWVMDMCNRAGTDMWINIPYKTIDPADFPNGDDFNNEYVHKMAILFKYGVDMKSVNLKNLVGGKANLNQLQYKSKQDFINWGGVDAGITLSSSAKIYVEYSNELWCCGRPQVVYSIAKAKLIGYPNDQYSYHKFGAYAEVRVWRAFQDVFGNNPRVVRVAGPCENWNVKIDEAFAIYNSTAANRNPWGVKPNYWKWATYIGVTGKSTDANFPAEWDNAVAGSAVTDGFNGNRSWKSLRDQMKNQYNLDLICYEGGQALADNDGAHDARSFSAGAGGTYQRYQKWLQTVHQYFKLVCHYTDYGNGDDCGDIQRTKWGAKSYPGQTTNKFKFDAIKAWIDGTMPVVGALARVQVQTKDSALISGSTIRPNPTTGSFNINFTGNKNSSSSISIADVTGKIVYRKTVFLSAGSSNQTFNPGLSGGIYFISISTGGKTTTERLLITK
jgi:hypothetical protein